MDSGMSYKEYLEYKQIERVRASRERDREREKIKPRAERNAVPHQRRRAIDNMSPEIIQLKAVLLAYRKKAKSFDALVEKAKAIVEDGAIRSSADGIGERHGGRKSDLSDKIAKADSLRERAKSLFVEIWDGRFVVTDIWGKGYISHNCHSYVIDAYFAGTRQISSKLDIRYIEELQKGMSAAGASFDLMANVLEKENRPL